ncbi:hypothetical protein E3N88_37917 [Mikania micrantha]|uniref:Uncharacterized protein n=1 Tax=Mikania micrantha TaxID=192012 RepID=A0A5N6LSR5_9ASTR|nr:hypothetical protein E3N88_37917 [Mikania micrantha]
MIVVDEERPIAIHQYKEKYLGVEAEVEPVDRQDQDQDRDRDQVPTIAVRVAVERINLESAFVAMEGGGDGWRWVVAGAVSVGGDG